MKKSTIVFNNLIDPKSGEAVTLEVPASLDYKGGMRAAGEAGERAGQHIREMIDSPSSADNP